MSEQTKLQIAVQAVDFVKSQSTNPWGDFSQIAIVTFRNKKEGGAHPSFYFKIVDEDHRPIPMTEQEFTKACVESHLAKAELPTLVSL